MRTDEELKRDLGDDWEAQLFPHGRPITVSNNHRTLREEVIRHRFATCRDLLQSAKRNRWQPDRLEQALAVLEDTRP